MTVTVLSPTRRTLPPEITTDECGLLASATMTALVAAGSTVIGPETATPFTVNVLRVTSLDRTRTTRVTVYTRFEPSAAVTVTVKVFLPSCKPLLPATATTDSTSDAVAITLTALVKAGSPIEL